MLRDQTAGELIQHGRIRRAPALRRARRTRRVLLSSLNLHAAACVERHVSPARTDDARVGPALLCN